MQIKTTIKYAVLLFFTIISFSVQGAVTNLIEPVKFFTNHDVQFDNVSNRLLIYNQVGIVGISGVGKTQLARTYAYRNQEIYDIVWFFDCNTDLAEQFLRLAKAVNENIIQNDKQKLPENIEIVQNAVIEYLTPRKKWLLVFDNLTINRNHRIKDIIKWEHNGHVILCSQDSESLPSPVKMSFFSFKDSIDILIKLMGDIDQNIINELAQIFNGNPVLIVKAALFLKDNQYINIEEYKKILSKSKNQVQVHIELVLKQLDDSTKDFLNKLALLNNHKLSKNIMEHIVKDKDDLTRILYNLSRFGLIETANEDCRIFEMHDTVKEAILNITSQNTNHKIINILLDEFNNITPPKEGSLHRYSTISKDEAMISNHEKLLENSEKYKADISKIMELRKNLMDFYGINKDHPNCKRMTEWLKEKEEKEVFDISLMNNDTKAAYSWYLALMGMYEDSIYFNKAKSVLKQVQDYPRMDNGNIRHYRID